MDAKEAYKAGYDHFPRIGHLTDDYPKDLRDAFDQGWKDAGQEEVEKTSAKEAFRKLHY